MGDYRDMDCDVAREALSARIDGESEPVPAVRVDEHVAACADCRAWFDGVTSQADRLRMLARPRPVAARSPRTSLRHNRFRMSVPRWALLGVGAVQLGLAVVQALGLDVGFAHQHGMAMSGHLLNESTAWSAALGVVMVLAAIRPGAAAGLAGVLSVFVGTLTAFVLADAFAGAVTLTRVLTHLPVVLGAVLAVLVWRGTAGPGPSEEIAADAPITLPHNATRGRRRDHLWPTDGSAA